LSIILYFDIIGRIYPVRSLQESEASLKAFFVHPAAGLTDPWQFITP